MANGTYSVAARGWSAQLQSDLDLAMARVAELKLIREKAVGELVDLMKKLDVRKLALPASTPGLPLSDDSAYRRAAEILIDHAYEVRALLGPFAGGDRSE